MGEEKLKKKMLSIFIIIMMIVTVIPVAGSINQVINNDIKNNEMSKMTRANFKLKQLGFTYIVTPIDYPPIGCLIG